MIKIVVFVDRFYIVVVVVIVVGGIYIALFSALEQTNCARM